MKMFKEFLDSLYREVKTYEQYRALDMSLRWKLFDGSPENLNIAYECVDRHVDEEVTALRIKFDDGHTETHTFRELSRYSSQFANMLCNHRIGKGDVVFVLSDHCMEYFTAVYGALKRGAVVSLASPLLGVEGIRYRIKLSNPRLAIAPRERKDVFSGLVEDLISIEELFDILKNEDAKYECSNVTSANDPAVIQFSSGTTGLPKMRTYVHAAVTIRAMSEVFGVLKPPKAGRLRMFGIAAVGWGQATWGIMFCPMSLGYAAGVYSGRFNPTLILEALEEFQINVFYAIPTALRKILGQCRPQDYDLRLERIQWVGEHMDAHLYEEVRKAFGVPLYGRYGSMEFGGVIGDPVLEDHVSKPGSMGRPLMGNEVAILDENGNKLPPYRIGEIAVWRKGGWIRSGDLAYVDSENYFWWVSRADDVIISAGYTIGPEEIEYTLNSHPAVAESAVVAAPDPERGYAPCAFIVLKQGVRESGELIADLQNYVRERLSKHLYPRKFIFVQELPRTPDGKIKRRELRERLVKVR